MKLSKQIPAVVSGGASGLGEASARMLANHGAKVALFDLNEERGERIAKEIGGLFCKTDVTSEDDVRTSFEKARATHGQERIVVNCAGIAIAKKTVSRDRETGKAKMHEYAQFKKVVDINLNGTFNMIAQAALGMMDSDPITDDGERGVIISTSSVAAQDGQVGQVAYAASKGGVLGMTLPIARDLAREGIRVNTILPGLFMTPLFEELPEEARLSLGKSVPFPQRLGNPEEFAQLVEQMCENPMLNAAAVRLDGAIRMAPR